MSATDDLLAVGRLMHDALRPFARFAAIYPGMGGNAPRSGVVHAIENRAGRAELTVEDFERALRACAAWTEGR